jgi:hypothetical protein
MDATTGTFVASEVDDETAVLRDVDSGQVLTLGEHPDPPLDRQEVLRGTVAPQPPTDVVWEVEAVERRWTVDLVESGLSPTKQARELADGIAVGELITRERAGDGEVHVLGVDDPAAAVADVLGDEETVARAARLGAVRVEVRTGEHFLNVRYLPD